MVICYHHHHHHYYFFITCTSLQFITIAAAILIVRNINSVMMCNTRIAQYSLFTAVYYLGRV